MNPNNGVGPPKSEVPASREGTGTHHDRHVDSQDITAPSTHHAFDALSGNARRYAAKRRMTPLPPCGCIRDPEIDQHRCGADISDHMAEAAAAAIVLLDQLGTPGLLDHRTCRAMWRAGHRRLATAVHLRTAGAA